MRLQSPSISELHAFAQAARLGSYTQAAESLQVTQGAISRAIARLEEHLGFAVFERQGKRNVLTTAGRQYLDAIAPAIFTIESTTQAIRRKREGRRVRLSMPPTLFSHWLIPRLPDFNARHPDTVLSFAPYRRDDPLTAPDIDAWIRIGSMPFPDTVEADYLIGRDLVPICLPQDALSICRPRIYCAARCWPTPITRITGHAGLKKWAVTAPALPLWRTLSRSACWCRQ